MSLFIKVTSTTEIYSLSLLYALPTFRERHEADAPRLAVRHARRPPAVPRRAHHARRGGDPPLGRAERAAEGHEAARARSEEHMTELQSRQYLVCRLLLEKKHSDHFLA